MKRLGWLLAGLCLLSVPIVVLGVWLWDWPSSWLGGPILALGSLKITSALNVMVKWTQIPARVTSSERQRSSGNIQLGFVYVVSGVEYKGECPGRLSINTGDTVSVFVNPIDPTEYKTRLLTDAILGTFIAIIGLVQLIW